MDILRYYEDKFKKKWDAAAIAHLTPSSSEAGFIYDHLLKVGPKQWLIDAELGNVFGTISTNSDDNKQSEETSDSDSPVNPIHDHDLYASAKSFYYVNGRLVTEEGVRLDDELLATLEFPSSTQIDIHLT